MPPASSTATVLGILLLTSLAFPSLLYLMFLLRIARDGLK